LEVYPVLKRFFCILFIPILAISAIPAKACEKVIPAPVSSFFDTPEWEGYQCVSSLVHDEGNGGTGTAALIMRKDTLDVLCIFHIKDGRWELVVKNDSILPRTDLLPIQFDSEDPNWVSVMYNRGSYWEFLRFYLRGSTFLDRPLVWSFSRYGIYSDPFDPLFDRFGIGADNYTDGLFYLDQSLHGEDVYTNLPLYSTWDIDLRSISYEDIPKTYTQVLSIMSEEPQNK